MNCPISFFVLKFAFLSNHYIYNCKRKKNFKTKKKQSINQKTNQTINQPNIDRFYFDFDDKNIYIWFLNIVQRKLVCIYLENHRKKDVIYFNDWFCMQPNGNSIGHKMFNHFRGNLLGGTTVTYIMCLL